MPDTILVAVAWPYANADIHAGNIAGAYLPADIFARYHRLAGNRVLMVSGTDSHGTPITVRADAEHTTPQALYERFHRRFLDLFLQAGLSYDLFTSTHTENHFRVSQDFFLALQSNGYLYRQSEDQWYSPDEGRFLPDRYVEGECYICHYPNARGDQCDNCGSLLDSTQLIQPHARTGGGRLELRPTEHFYLDLAKLTPALERYLSDDKDHWRANVLPPLAPDRSQRRAARARHHPRSRLGDPRPGRRLDRQVPVRLVRGGHRLPFGLDRMGSAPGLRRKHGRIGGTTQPPARTTSSARTTSPSTPSSGRPS